MSQTDTPEDKSKMVIRIKMTSPKDSPMADEPDVQQRMRQVEVEEYDKKRILIAIGAALLVITTLVFWLTGDEQVESITDITPASTMPSNADTNAEALITTEQSNSQVTEVEVASNTFEESAGELIDTLEPEESAMESAISDFPETSQITADITEPAITEVVTEMPAARSTSSSNEYSKNVARAVFANKIVNREPVNVIENQINANTEGFKRVNFFSEFRNMKGEKIIHRWIYNDKIEAEVPFQINGDRWRVYSNKGIVATKTGLWQVDIVHAATDDVIASRSFIYGSEQ